MTGVGAAAAKSFLAADYRSLERAFTEFCTGQKRMPDGTWALKHFEDGLARHFSIWRYSKAIHADILKWQAESPDSSAAYWVESLYWYGAAWSLPRPQRGERRSELNQKVFAERLLAAEGSLNRMKQMAVKCPAIDVRALEIQIDRGASLDAALAMFEAVRKVYPQYHGLYAAMARVHFSATRGHPVAREKFAWQAAQMAFDFEGAGMYGRLHSRMHLERTFGPTHWIGEFTPDWERLREAFEDLVRRYPESKVIVADYLDQACRIGDAETYRRLRNGVVGLEAHGLTDTSLDVCDRKHSWKGNRWNHDVPKEIDAPKPVERRWPNRIATHVLYRLGIGAMHGPG